MANHSLYQVIDHYLVSIKYESDVIRNWDVYIASSSGEEYYGKAILGAGEKTIPWIKLKNEKLTPAEEMISIIKMTFKD